MNIQVRFAYTYDYDRIVEIANSDGFNWSAQEILQTIKEPNIVIMVAVDENKVLGFCIYSISSPDEIMIVHLATEPLNYRQGVATKIIDKLKNKMQVNDNRDIIVYALPESNLRGQLFLKKMGFTAKLLRSIPEDITEFVFKK